MGKIIKSVGAILVAGVICAGVCCMGYASRGDSGKWFGNGDIKTWHWNDKADGDLSDNPDKNSTGGNEGNGDILGGGWENTAGGTMISESTGNGMRLLSARIAPGQYEDNGIMSASVDSGYRLSASITPSDEYFHSVDWSVEWVNPDSSFARDKEITDYVTVTSDSDGSLLAVLECKQAFGAQIKVTCASRVVPSVKSECFVDYSKRIIDFSLETNGIRWFGDARWKSPLWADYNRVKSADENSRIKLFPQYSVYTVYDTFTITYKRKLVKQVYEHFISIFGGVSTPNGWRGIEWDVDASKGFGVSPAQIAADYGYSLSSERGYALSHYLASYLCSSAEVRTLPYEYWTVTATGTHSSITQRVEFGFTESSLLEAAGNITLSDTSVIF